MNSCYFFPSMPHGKIKCIFCNQGTLLFCHYLKTFNNSRNILKEKCTSNNMSPDKRTNQLTLFYRIFSHFNIIWDLQSNLYITALYIAVTLYIKVTMPFPKGDRCTLVWLYRAFSHDVTAAILVSQNNETAATVGVPNQSYGSWTLFLCKGFLLF